LVNTVSHPPDHEAGPNPTPASIEWIGRLLQF